MAQLLRSYSEPGRWWKFPTLALCYLAYNTYRPSWLCRHRMCPILTFFIALTHHKSLALVKNCIHYLPATGDALVYRQFSTAEQEQNSKISSISTTSNLFPATQTRNIFFFPVVTTVTTAGCFCSNGNCKKIRSSHLGLVRCIWNAVKSTFRRSHALWKWDGQSRHKSIHFPSPLHIALLPVIQRRSWTSGLQSHTPRSRNFIRASLVKNPMD